MITHVLKNFIKAIKEFNEFLIKQANNLEIEYKFIKLLYFIFISFLFWGSILFSVSVVVIAYFLLYPYSLYLLLLIILIMFLVENRIK